MKTYENNGINKDGSFRVRRIGVKQFTLSEVYNSLVTMSWSRFFLFTFITYLILAFLFTLAYGFTDFENLKGATAISSSDRFWEVFLYSAQTMSTVGGVGITPVGIPNNLILTVESLMALLCAAIITGLLYVRFSRPSAKIVYSENALISPYKGGKAFMMRVGNAKKIDVVELSAHLFFVTFDPATNKRNFTELSLEQKHLPFNATTWTILHAIEVGSPFFNYDQGQLEKVRFDISVYISALDSVTGQSVFSRHAYSKQDILWNAKFLPCGEMNEQGETLVYLNKISDFEELKS